MGSTSVAKDTELRSKGGPTYGFDLPPSSGPGHHLGQLFSFPARVNMEVTIQWQQDVNAMNENEILDGENTRTPAWKDH